ncbi:MAG: sensor histidine kinase [Fusicatenibacter sp.]
MRLIKSAKRKPSVKTKIALAFIATMAVTLILIGLIHYFFLGRYYSRHKEEILSSSFLLLNEVGPYKSSDIPDTFEHFCATNNLKVIITGPELGSYIYSNATDRQSLQTLIFGLISGNEQENIEIIESSRNYQIQKFHDRYIGGDYLQLIGWFDNGNCYFARCPLESIDDAVNISNQFYTITGCTMILVGAVVIWLIARKIVQPIQELTGISKRMAALDFDARYTSGGKDEIGELGNHFNIMSEKLEQVIAELKSANVELQKDINEKIQIDEMRREFLSNVTHELKTPIALIQGYAEGLKDNISDDAESREFYCDVIVDEASKMNEMVKKLLNLNQLEFGEDQVTMERFDLAAVIRGVLQSSAILIKQKEAVILFSQETPIPVWGDEFKVEEVITNYLTNALNHLNSERTIEISCKKEQGIVTTTVFNTGDPIPEEDLDKIWIKFFKVDKARTREYGGSGIGLSIVKAITDSMNQHCGCRNYDNGVAFWFTLEADEGAGEKQRLLSEQ